jgi:tripartite-type tricarboxylate transporter receptor subunit TctC
MHLSRCAQSRPLLWGSLIVLTLTVSAVASALAQELPSGTARIIVPYPPGGPLDVTARLVAQGLRDDLGKNFIIENKSGANGNLGAGAAVQSAPDGLTLLAITDTILTANPALYPSVPFDPFKDFAPISVIGSNAVVLGVHKSLPVKTIGEFVDYMKTHNTTFSSGGNGSPGHLAYESFALRAGVKGTHVAYRGGAPAAQAIGSHEVDAGIVSPSALRSFIAQGTVVPLAVLDTKRIGSLPSVPTAAEGGISNLIVRYYSLLLAPAGTPAALIEKFNHSVRDTFARPATLSVLGAAGLEPTVSTPAEATEILKEQTARWKEVIQASGMRMQ